MGPSINYVTSKGGRGVRQMVTKSDKGGGHNVFKFNFRSTVKKIREIAGNFFSKIGFQNPFISQPSLNEFLILFSNLKVKNKCFMCKLTKNLKNSRWHQYCFLKIPENTSFSSLDYDELRAFTSPKHRYFYEFMSLDSKNHWHFLL